ncbi:MAG: phosphoribosylformylglycinamidine synthase subunit PurQ [Ignavibacteriae bacterium]|nr:phosphoribosylformylglycinamidine synthase subunit PurQ [Ignavibacteriota bacterium]
MSKLKVGIVVFPGSNRDHDAQYAMESVMKLETRLIWHKEGSVGDVDAVILPGGFSYGDYLRCGAIARFSPIMTDVVRFAKSGGIVMGICNGFQILAEAGLLPGVLLRNESLKFVCDFINLRVENNQTRFSSQCNQGDVLRVLIAHGDGNYFAEPDTVKRLEDNRQIVFRYCDERGNVTKESSPNGSINNIAGIINEQGNVLGMMPHPENAVEPVMGSSDGRKIFESLVESFVYHSLSA